MGWLNPRPVEATPTPRSSRRSTQSDRAAAAQAAVATATNQRAEAVAHYSATKAKHGLCAPETTEAGRGMWTAKAKQNDAIRAAEQPPRRSRWW